MADTQLLEQIRKVVREEIETSEKRVIQKVVQKIDESQEDTIKVLSDLIHAGYENHEQRITTIEKELHSSKN